MITIINQRNKMKPLNTLAVVAVVFAFSWAQIERAKAESLELFFDNEPRSERNSIWKGDGSLVIIDNAKDSGYIIKDGEVEYYVEPKDNGEPTFIYDNELIICTKSSGCY